MTMDTSKQKIEKLYQSAMDLRDSLPSFDGSRLLESIYIRQYFRAYWKTQDVVQFAWETRLYRRLYRNQGKLGIKS